MELYDSNSGSESIVENQQVRFLGIVAFPKYGVVNFQYTTGRDFRGTLGIWQGYLKIIVRRDGGG